MDVRISLLIIGFQLLNWAMAEWDPLSPLVLVGKQRIRNMYPNKTFPVMVQLSTHPQYQNCVVYSDEIPESAWGAFAYCPQQGQNPKCNYPTWFLTAYYYEGGGPTDKCELEVVYDMIPIVHEVTRQHEPCFQSQGLKYKIVYRVCQKDYPELDKEVVVYELCYDHDENRIIYGNFNIQNVSLLEDPLLRDEQEYAFNFSINPIHNDVLGFVNEIYQQYPDYVPVLVLPPQLVAFGNQRRPFFDSTNIAPMLRDLKPGWDELMRNLKNKLSTHMNDNYNPIRVTAGLLRFKSLRNTRNNLWIKIPRAWCIVLFTESYHRGVAIIMHNEIYNPANPDTPLSDQHCGRHICDRALIPDVIPESPINFIYCCNARYIWSQFRLQWTRHQPGVLQFKQGPD